MKYMFLCAGLAATVLYSTAPSVQAEEKYKMTMEIAPGVAVPDTIETSLGTLNLNYEFPDEATTQKVL